jgi:hypothetical protein
MFRLSTRLATIYAAVIFIFTLVMSSALPEHSITYTGFLLGDLSLCFRHRQALHLYCSCSKHTGSGIISIISSRHSTVTR